MTPIARPPYNTKMRRTLPVLLLVLCSALPVAAAEVAIAPVAEAPATLSQKVASSATDGNDFLFVWSDVTHGIYDCRATRVTREGVILDRGGIPIPAHERNSVVWTGTLYLILWNRFDIYGIDQQEIHGIRVGRDGAILDGPGLIQQQASMSSVISEGTHTVIEYRTRQADGTFDQHALFLDAEGKSAADVLLAEGTLGEIARIAWNGRHFVAVWVNNPSGMHKDYTLEAIHFDIHGPLDPAPRQLLSDPSSDFADALDVASDGDSFLLVTRRGDLRYYAQRISPDLGTLGPPHILPWIYYDQEKYYKTNYSSSVFWDGSSYLRLAHWGGINLVRMDR